MTPEDIRRDLDAKKFGVTTALQLLQKWFHGNLQKAEEEFDRWKFCTTIKQ